MKTEVKTLRYNYNFHNLYLPLVTILTIGFLLSGSTPIFAQTGSAIATVSVSNATPTVGNQVVATININLSGVNAPNNLLGSYTGTLNWNTTVLSYQSYSGAPPASFSGSVNTSNTGSGQISFNGANSSGAAGTTIAVTITFNVVGAGTSQLDLAFSAMAAATTFNSLLGILTVNDSQVNVAPPSGSIAYIGDLGSGTQTTAATLTTVITLSNSTSLTAGDAIIIAYTTDAAPDIPITITNSWSATDKYQVASMGISTQQNRTYIFAAYNVTGLTAGSGNTITITEALPTSGTQPQYRAAVASVFRGLAPVGALEQSSNGPANTTAVSNTSPSSGSITTVQPIQLLIGAVGTKGSDVSSPGTWASGWTNGPIAGTTGETISMAYQIVSSAGSYTASKTLSTNRYWTAAIASFKSSATGISYIGDIGSAQSKSSSNNLAITLPAGTNVAAGDAILVSIGSNTNGNTDVAVSSVTDASSNVYSEVVNVTNTTSPRVRTSLWTAYNVNALSAGNTITINYASAVTSRAAVASVFRGLGASPVDKTGTGTGSGTTPSATIASPPTTQADELLIGVAGIGGGNYDAPGVWSNAFSSGPRIGTGSGTTTTGTGDITESLGWKIVSATGTYTAAKGGVASRLWAAGIATFKYLSSPPVQYTINATAGSNGSIAPTGSVSVTQGNNQSFTITPNSGYRILSVLVDGGSVGTVTTYTFTNVVANHTIAASFELIPTYTIAASADANGSISPSGNVSVAQGNNQSFSITANSGYRIASVLVDGSSAGKVSTYQFTNVQAVHTIAASFEVIPAGSITHIGDIGTVYADAAGTTLNIPVGSSGVSAGNTIIVGFASRGASTYNQPTLADGAGNTYNLASFGVTYSHGRSYIFYAYVEHALTNGQNITITTSSVGSRVAVASVFSGLANVNALDQALGYPTLDAQITAQSNNPSVGPTGITSQTNELIIGMIGTEDASSSADAGVGTWLNDFIAGPTIKTSSGASYLWRVSMGYKIVSATAAFTAAKTVTSNPYWAASIATFKTENILPSSSYNILLGRPTSTSITVNGIFDQDGSVYFEYGKTSGNYNSGQTSTLTATSGIPVEAVINGLDPDSRYYYRLRFQPTGNSSWVSGDEHSFQTQRVKNEAYKFTITSDSHLGETFSGITPARYDQTTKNIAADNPDFHIDLGDAFMMNTPTNQTQANDIYKAQRPYFGNFSNSAPVFLALGNHELESGWNLDDTPFSKALASIIARKQYFLNPTPDGFYTGNTDLLPALGGDQYREDYYSWVWGDALFIVLDPYQYTMTKPYGNVTGSGEDNDETVSGDQWNWTLGLQQFNWLKQTLENSHAKYKFVFSHHMTGGILNVSGGAGTPEYVRGGAEAASYFEWGGQNANGTNGFGTKRPGWGDTPIHQLMVANGVSAYFHGHDHQFVHEERDGIVYQEVPSASMTGLGFDLYGNSPYVMTENGTLGNLSNSGHLRITVNPNQATVEYVRSNENNGQVAYSYTINPNANIEPAVTVTSPNGGENWQVGSVHNITWSSTGITGNVHIEYSINNGSVWSDVIASTSNTGSYSWTIPNTTSANCVVRVSDLAGTPLDVSDAVFTISPIPVITVIAPNGSENWQVGSIYNITWSSTGITGNVHIEYSTNNGTAWSDVIASTSNTGSYSWTIPNTTSVSCIVRVSDLDGTPSDVSNAVFTISAVPYVVILSPNGGEDWKTGSIHTISWTSTGTSGNVHIEYSSNNGGNWNDVIASTTDDGSYSWTIPIEQSVNCIVKVSDTDGTPFDVSNSVFAISPEPDKHFVPVWANNGFDHMNFYALSASLDGADLQPGDEIGIFDGTYCVGSGKLTQILNGSNYLETRVSRDDPSTAEVDGYTAGHNATFKIWDASAHSEISSAQITYETGSNSIFDIGTSSWYHISGVSSVSQDITLSNGWSIFSLYVTPGNINMQQVVQPLIDAGSLVKVQNEGGAAIEKIPGTSTWVNNIGNWSYSEGYKIRVNTLSSLIVTGIPVAAPLAIDLTSGWNIISYPVSAPQDAMQILNAMVPAGSLVKVQDQAGNAIELIPNTTNWINNIGNFDPDEGYKVRVSANSVISMTNSGKGSKGSFVSIATNSTTQYYKPVLTGNGLDQMNFYLTDVSEGESGLKPGDEIGIFDGSNCVGAAKITKTGEKFYSFVASADDPTTEETDGFIKGHSPSFRIWRPATNSEATIGTFDYYPGSDKVFVLMGTAAISINVSTLNLNSEIELSTTLGDNYPNPFRGETTIPFVVGRESTVDISIYNLLGTKMTTLVHEILPAGSYKTLWNAASEQNKRIVPGIYYCKMISGKKVFVKTMVVNY